MAEIIKVLDTSLAASAEIKGFALKFADAKALATIIQSVLQTQGGRGGGAAASSSTGSGSSRG
jgi:hypothetical protein